MKLFNLFNKKEKILLITILEEKNQSLKFLENITKDELKYIDILIFDRFKSDQKKFNEHQVINIDSNAEIIKFLSEFNFDGYALFIRSCDYLSEEFVSKIISHKRVSNHIFVPKFIFNSEIYYKFNDVDNRNFAGDVKKINLSKDMFKTNNLGYSIIFNFKDIKWNKYDIELLNSYDFLFFYNYIGENNVNISLLKNETYNFYGSTVELDQIEYFINNRKNIIVNNNNKFATNFSILSRINKNSNINELIEESSNNFKIINDLKEIILNSNENLFTEQRGLLQEMTLFRTKDENLFYGQKFLSACKYVKINVWSRTLDLSFETGDKKYNLKDIEYFDQSNFMQKSLGIFNIIVTVPSTTGDVNIISKSKTQNLKFELCDNVDENSTLLFFDRVNKAGDSADVLYDWWRKEHPEYKQIYFAIQKEAADYERLKNRGYNVIDFGSKEFEKIYLKADFIFSSHTDNGMDNFKGLRSSFKSKARYFALQHGVTEKELFHWFNLKRIHYISVSTNVEVEMAKKFSHLGPQVVESGLARFQKYNHDNVSRKIIYVPTWRQYFNTTSEEVFKKSDYFNFINEFFESEELALFLEKNNLEFELILHPYMSRFSNLFGTSSNRVFARSAFEISYNDEIETCICGITDVSSIVSDVIFLKKPIIYYQPERDNTFLGHTFNKYFDYEEKGPGPVIYDFKELLEYLEELNNNEFKLDKFYTDRRKEYFCDIEEKQCEKIYEAVLKND